MHLPPFVWRSVFFCGAVLTAMDVCMTAGFGFLSQPYLLSSIIFMLALGALALMLALMPAVVGALMRLPNSAAKWIVIAGICGFYVYGFGMNQVSNIGFSSAMSKGGLQKADNHNEKAERIRSEIERIDGIIAEKKSSTAWRTEYSDPQSYETLIAAANQYIEMESARGGCKTKCEARMKERDSLLAERDMAVQRKALQADIISLEDERARLIEQSKSVQVEMTPVAAQALTIAQLWTFSLQPDGDSRDWSALTMWVAVSLAISLAGAVCNFVVAATAGPPRAAAYDHENDVRVAENPFLGVDRSRPGVTPNAAYARRQGFDVPVPQPLSVVVNESSDDERWQRVKQYLVSKGAMPA